MTEICIKCNVAYLNFKNGIIVEELSNLTAYKLWSADIKECPRCHHQIVSGFAKEAFSDHYEKDYQDIVSRAKKDGRLIQWKEK